MRITYRTLFGMHPYPNGAISCTSRCLLIRRHSRLALSSRVPAGRRVGPIAKPETRVRVSSSLLPRLPPLSLSLSLSLDLFIRPCDGFSASESLEGRYGPGISGHNDLKTFRRLRVKHQRSFKRHFEVSLPNYKGER
jgi:hypothetical protein